MKERLTIKQLDLLRVLYHNRQLSVCYQHSIITNTVVYLVKGENVCCIVAPSTVASLEDRSLLYISYKDDSNMYKVYDLTMRGIEIMKEKNYRMV